MKQNEHVQIRDIHTYKNGNASVSLLFLYLDRSCTHTKEEEYKKRRKRCLQHKKALNRCVSINCQSTNCLHFLNVSKRLFDCWFDCTRRSLILFFSIYNLTLALSLIFEYNVICSLHKLYVNNIHDSLVPTPEYKHSMRKKQRKKEKWRYIPSIRH